MNDGERTIAAALASGDRDTALALFEAFAQTWKRTGDIRTAWVAAFEVARRLGAADPRFPAFAEVMAGEDGAAKRAVITALLGEVEPTPEGMARDQIVAMDFPEGVAAAVLRMRQFEADLNAGPRPRTPTPAEAARLPLPQQEDE